MKLEELSAEKRLFVESLKQAGTWVYLIERPICFLVRNLILLGEKSTAFNNALGARIPPIGDAFFKKGIFVPQQAIQQVSGAIDTFFQVKRFAALQRIGKDCQSAGNQLLDYLSTRPEPGASTFLQVKEHYTRLTSYLLVVVFAESYLEKKLAELVTEKCGTLDPRYYNALVYTRKYNGITNELRDLLSLCIDINKKKTSLDDPAIDQRIQQHAATWGWLGTKWYLEPPWTPQQIRERIQHHLAHDPEQALRNIQEPRAEAESMTQEFISTYPCSKSDIALIDTAKEFVFLRTFRTEYIAHANNLLRPLLVSFGQAHGYTLSDLSTLSLDEIASIGQGKDWRKVIAERKQDECMILWNDRIQVFTGKETEAIAQSGLFCFPKVKDSEVKGQIAWKGKARGQVRKVASHTDLDKVRPGDVLVAVMTFPDYVPAMERAAAFVTDEGGILCHAAILSRELKKPCIIATRTATKQLNDGDVVEVDAESGVVRVLERLGS